ncbi:TolC family protein [Halarcobacter bivalviorum]|uniref:Type I secretion system outer membrane protein, TolC family n=1 Tax=Halarcobacter bivalviorum TaxID=663364 RepID=A0AAX2A984_9BACT|nr:TolC family protein [Halarcobacter bivalviorum]AXH13382.1 type I secretion system outer membrane protein, TolC family [Halarcobacter bivalviorum]RXK10015.1 hypothetical protein CRV05_06460 [Halarcobacter bivalviorum]
MKKLAHILLVTGISFSASNAVSLKESVVRTLDTNPDVLSEKLNKEAYRKYVDEEKADYYPTLDFQAFLEDTETRSDRDNVETDPTTGRKDGWNTSLTLEQIIYDGGKTPSEVEEFRHKYFSNKYRSNQRVEEIVKRTVDSYLDLVKYQELLDLSNLNLKIHEDYLILAQEKEAVSGEILETYEVNSKKHFLIDRYLEQEVEQKEIKNTFLQYTSIKNVGNVCRPQIDDNLIPKTSEENVEDALRKNLKILKAVEDIKEQRENIVQANATFLPTLRFQWQGSLDDDLAYPENGRQDISRSRLILNWNLFEGGKNKIQKEREKLFLLEKQKILDNVVNEVVKEANTNYYKYQNQKKRIENYKKYVQDNKNIRDVYIKQLEDGTRTFIDVLNAESEYYRSEIDLLNYEYELYQLYFNILIDRGMLSYSVLTSNNQSCKAFIPTKYNSRFKNQNKKDDTELKDLDLLNELGADLNLTKEEQLSADKEISDIINGKKVEVVEEKVIETTKAEFPEGKYTINIASIDQKESVKEYLNNYKLNKDKIFAYNTNNTTNLIYGSFDNLENAISEMKNIDKNIIDKKIYIDTLSKHKLLYDKFKSNNQ